MIRLDGDGANVREAYAHGRGSLARVTLPSDLDTPVSAFLKLGRDRANAFLLESVEGGANLGRYSVIGLAPDAIWRVVDGQAQRSVGPQASAGAPFTPDPRAPIDSLRALLAESAVDPWPDAPGLAAGVYGYLGYEMAAQAERLPVPPADPLGTPTALLLRPTVVLVFDTVKQELALYAPVRPAEGVDVEAALEMARARLLGVVESLSAQGPSANGVTTPGAPLDRGLTMAPEAYRAAVERSVDYVRAGDVFQVLPSQRFTAPFALPPFALYRSLRRTNPSPFMFYFNFEDFAVVGASPEVLVRVRERAMTLRPIAGTRPRGADAAEDAALERDLLADPKERAEHLMLVDLARNDIGRVAEAGSVQVTESFVIERYSHVMHIVSNVEGRLREGVDALDAFLAGFPHGTVTGAPKLRAMEIIAELEGERRGVYAGGVGCFSAMGPVDTCIALRTAVVKDGTLHMRAGAGVVFDSDPETERLETEHKSAALFAAAGDARRFV